MLNNKLTLASFGLLLSGLILIGAACPSQQPSEPDLGGPMEGGSMAEGSCETLCNSLEAKKDRLLKQKAEELVKGAGCELGKGAGAASGTMFGGVDYNCPDQASAERLGQANQDYKDNPRRSDLDKEIDDTQKEIDANCPCEPEMVQVVPCSICAGVPPGGLCPTYFYTEEECIAKGGTPSPN